MKSIASIGKAALVNHLECVSYQFSLFCLSFVFHLFCLSCVYPNWEFEMWSGVSYEYLDTYNILCVMSYYNMTLLRYKERKQLTLATAEAEKRMRNAGIFVKSET